MLITDPTIKMGFTSMSRKMMGAVLVGRFMLRTTGPQIKRFTPLSM